MVVGGSSAQDADNLMHLLLQVVAGATLVNPRTPLLGCPLLPAFPCTGDCWRCNPSSDLGGGWGAAAFPRRIAAPFVSTLHRWAHAAAGRGRVWTRAWELLWLRSADDLIGGSVSICLFLLCSLLEPPLLLRRLWNGPSRRWSLQVLALPGVGPLPALVLLPPPPPPEVNIPFRPSLGSHLFSFSFVGFPDEAGL